VIQKKSLEDAASKRKRDKQEKTIELNFGGVLGCILQYPIELETEKKAKKKKKTSSKRKDSVYSNPTLRKLAGTIVRALGRVRRRKITRKAESNAEPEKKKSRAWKRTSGRKKLQSKARRKSH